MKLEGHMRKYSNQSTHSLADSVATMDCPPFLLQMPPCNKSPASLTPASRSISSTATYDPVTNRVNDFIYYRPPSQNMVPRPEAWQLPGDELMNSDKSGHNSADSAVRYMDFDMQDHVPSLEEIRAHVAQETLPPPPAESPLTTPSPDKSEDLSRVVAELGALWSAVSTTQAEIAGISSIMAEYMAYMRKPAMAAAGYSGNGHNQALLGTLERRARDLQDMAGTRHVEAWLQLCERLGDLDGIGVQVQDMMAASEDRTRETAHFFRSSYDIRAGLDEQVGLPHRDPSTRDLEHK